MLKNQASQPALQALYQVAGWIATMPEVGACERLRFWCGWRDA